MFACVAGDESQRHRLDWLLCAFNFWSNIDVSSFSTHFRDARDEAFEADLQPSGVDPGQHGANLFVAFAGYSPNDTSTEFPTRLALLLHAVLIDDCATDPTTMQWL